MSLTTRLPGDTTHHRRHGRALALMVATVAMVAATACQPVPDAPPVPDGDSRVTVSTAVATRGSTVEVAATGCDDDEYVQFLEVRLVVGRGHQRRSAAVVNDAAPGTASFTVPQWVPSGPATIEVDCLEPDFSGASDGAEVLRFSYGSEAITIARSPRRGQQGSVAVERVVADGTLHVSGSDCSGQVAVRVARGKDLVGSSVRFRYGDANVTPDGDGTWAVELPLTYAVSSFSNPIAPGAMGVFASCDGVAYRPEVFRISRRSPAPAIHPLWNAATLYLGQCSPENEMIVKVRATSEDGTVQTETFRRPGQDFGEQFLSLPLSSDVVAADYRASCRGPAPSFTYAPASYPSDVDSGS